jgi:hypothetical protein
MARPVANKFSSPKPGESSFRSGIIDAPSFRFDMIAVVIPN